MQAFVDLISCTLVTAEADDGKLSLDHARLDLRDADGRVDDLAQKRTGEGTDGMLGGTVDRTASVRLATYQLRFNIYRPSMR